MSDVPDKVWCEKSPTKVIQNGQWFANDNDAPRLTPYIRLSAAYPKELVERLRRSIDSSNPDEMLHAVNDWLDHIAQQESSQ